MIPANPTVKALLVFNKDDAVLDAILRSCERLNFEAFRAKSIESALDIFQNPITGGHHLVIVDDRCKNIDSESFGRYAFKLTSIKLALTVSISQCSIRSIRSSKGNQYTTMVAVVKKR